MVSCRATRRFGNENLSAQCIQHVPEFNLIPGLQNNNRNTKNSKNRVKETMFTVSWEP